MKKKVTFYFLVFIVSALLLIFFSLRSQALRGHIKRYVLVKVVRALGSDVSIGDLNVNLFPPRLKINNLTLNDYTFRGTKIDIKVPEVEVKPVFIQAVMGKIILDKVTLNYPVLYLEVVETDRIIQKLAPPTLPSKPEIIKVVVNNLTVNDSGIKITYPDGDLAYNIDGLSFQYTKKDKLDKKRVQLKAKGALLQMGEQEFKFEEIEGKLSLDKDDIKIKNFRAGISSGPIELSGTIFGFDILDISIHASLDLSKLPETLKGIPTLSGEAVFDAVVSGNLKDPIIKGNLVMNTVQANGILINSVHSPLIYQADKLEISDARINAFGGEFKFQGMLKPRERYSYSSFLEFNNISLQSINESLFPENDIPHNGQINGSLRLSGNLADDPNFECEGTISSPQLNILLNGSLDQWLKAHHLIAKFSIKGDREGIGVEKLDLNTDHMGINLHGEVLINEKNQTTTSLSYECKFDDLTEFSPLFGKSLKGKGTLKGDITGDVFNKPKVKMRFDLRELAWGRYKHLDLKGRAYTDLNTVKLSGVNLMTKSSKLKIDGKFNARERSFSYRAYIIQSSLSDLLSILNLQRVKAEGNIRGKFGQFGNIDDLKNTTGEFSFLVSEIKLYGESFDEAEVDLAMNKGKLTLNGLDFKKGGGAFSANGSLYPELMVSLSGGGFDPDDFEFLARHGINLSGNVSMDGKLWCTPDNPCYAGSASLTSASLDDVELEGSNFWIELRDKSLRVSGLILGNNGIFDANVYAEDEFPFSLSAEINLPNIGPIIKIFQKTKHGAKESKLQAPSSKLQALGSRPQAGSMLSAADSLRSELRTPNSELTTPHTPSSVAELSVLRSITTKDELRRTGAPRISKYAINGRLSGTIDLKGTLNDLKSSEGEARIDRLDIGIGEFDYHALESTKLVFKDNTITFSELDISGANSLFRVKGSLEEFEQLDIISGGDTDLNILRLFFPEYMTKASGDVEFTIRLTGPISHPEFFGHANVSNGRLGFLYFPQDLEKIRGEVSLSTEGFISRNIKGSLGGGEFEVEGEVRMADYKVEQFLLFANLNDVNFKFPPWLPSLISGNVQLAGPKANPILSGNLHLKRALFTERVGLKEKMVDFAKKTRQVRGSPDEEGIRFDLGIRGEKGFWIKNNVANMEFGVKLRLIGTAKNLNILGDALGRQGEVYFKERPFNITSAFIEFDDPLRFNPKLYVFGKTVVKDVELGEAEEIDCQVFVRASGRIMEEGEEGLNITLSSDPPMGEDDIACLLYFSQPCGELIHGGGGGEAEAISLVVDRLIGKQLRKYFGLDKVEFDPIRSNFSDTPVPFLVLGKRISPSLYMKFLTDIGSTSGERRLEVEYDLIENIPIEGFIRNSPEEGEIFLGGEVKFRVEFW